MLGCSLSLTSRAVSGAAGLAPSGTTPAPSPTLAALSGQFELPENAVEGTVAGNILGASSGSTLSLITNAGGRISLSGSTLMRGITALDYETASSHTFTMRETLAGATNSPRDSMLTLSVRNVPGARSTKPQRPHPFRLHNRRKLQPVFCNRVGKPNFARTVCRCEATSKPDC